MFADLFVSRQSRQDAHKRHCCRRFAFARAVDLSLEGFQRWHGQRLRLGASLRQETAKRLAPLVKVFKFFAVGGRLVERYVVEILVRHRNVKAVAELANRIHIHFLLLMRGVLPFTGRAHAIAFDGFRQNNRRLTLVLRRRVVGRVNF